MQLVKLGQSRKQGKIRLIGVELRVMGPDGVEEEVGVFPLNVEIPAKYNAAMRNSGTYSFNVTVHTSAGDATTERQSLPYVMS